MHHRVIRGSKMVHSKRLPEVISFLFHFSVTQDSPRHVDERNDLAPHQRRFSMQSSAQSVTLPSGEAGQRQRTNQHQSEYGADLAQPYHRVSSGTSTTRPRSRTVLEPGRIPAGQSVTTSVPVSIARMRHRRQASNSATAVTSPLMNPIPPSSSTNTTNTGRSRQKRREITDARMALVPCSPHDISLTRSPIARHTRRTSRSASMLMAANPQQPLNIDAEHMWNPQPHFSGRRMESYPPNVVLSETPYSYDTNRSNMNCKSSALVGILPASN